jgi:hypothetical protein
LDGSLMGQFGGPFPETELTFDALSP